ncbi:50S ribosomal protein L18 [Candidatus Woesearchaeota archaeon]|nr:50S ribosomal protein L18 [Candidatus Woesearchaeota archaeon]
MQLKRKSEGRTNYRKRLNLLLSNKPRLVIRKSLTKITSQVIEYTPKGDKTIVSCNSKELEKYGWKGGLKNIPAAYLTGVLIGKKAIEKGVKEVTPDIGFNTPNKGAVIFALLRGAKDKGLKVNIKENISPGESRIKGQHIAEYSKINNNIFKSYKINPVELPKHFDEVKANISK